MRPAVGLAICLALAASSAACGAHQVVVTTPVSGAVVILSDGRELPTPATIRIEAGTFEEIRVCAEPEWMCSALQIDGNTTSELAVELTAVAAFRDTIADPRVNAPQIIAQGPPDGLGKAWEQARSRVVEGGLVLAVTDPRAHFLRTDWVQYGDTGSPLRIRSRLVLSLSASSSPTEFVLETRIEAEAYDVEAEPEPINRTGARFLDVLEALQTQRAEAAGMSRLDSSLLVEDRL